MPKRFLLALVLTVLPLAAAADDTTQDNSTTTAAAVTDPSVLGPQSTTTSGGSSADANALQPGGSSPLQSSTDSSLGLTSPNSNVLQAPVTSDAALKVLSGEADGPPHDPSASGQANPWLWLLFSLLIAGIAAGVVLRDRRRFREPPAEH
jgi:hypothetical protein